MELDPVNNTFRLTAEDQKAFGKPDVPEFIPLSEAAIYMERAELKRVALADVDPTEFPSGSRLSGVRNSYHKNIKVLGAMIRQFGEVAPSAADGAEAFLRDQSE